VYVPSWIFGIWKENGRRDAHGCAECNAMRDQMPRVNMIIAPESDRRSSQQPFGFQNERSNFDIL
jgi:hypothetical protein